jgi:predicted membrane protein
LLIVLLVLLLAVPFIAIAVAVAFLAAGGIDFGSGFDARYRPETVDEIPAMIDHGSGELVVDLTEIDPADYDGDPVPLAIDMSFGDITVLVPDDLRTSVDAQVSAGDVQVFGNSHDGLGADVSVDVDDADLELDIELEFGQITVQRAG